MRKVYAIITGIFLAFLFTSCKQFTADIDDFLSYWASEVSPVDYSIDKPQQTSADGSVCVPSADDVTVTVKLRNPKNFSLVMPTSPSDAGKVIGFPHLNPQPVYGTDYTLRQTAGDTLILKYTKAFLEKHEWGNGDIGPEITLTSDDGRVFNKKFSLNLKVNTAPVLAYAGIGKTSVGPDEYYVLLFRVKYMDKMIGTERVHKDINTLDVTAGGVTLPPIPLSIAGAEFATDENLLAASAVSSLDSSTLPGSTTQDWILRLKTNVKVGGPETAYEVCIKDEQGLRSAIRANTQKNKLNTVQLLDGSIQIGQTPTSEGATETNPKVFPGMSAKALAAHTSDGTGITGTIEKKNGSEWNQIQTLGDTTPITITLPALDSGQNEALYKITLKAQLTGYDDSDKKTFFVKLLRQELPVLKIKQDFSSSGQSFQKNISAETAGYVSEDIIPNAGNYNTATKPLVIYNLNGRAAFVIAPRTGSGATVMYKLNADPEHSATTEAPIRLPNAPATHTLQVWAVKNGVEGPKTTLHIKVIKAITAYSELKNVVQNAPAGNEIRINIANDITAPADIGNTEIAVTGGKKLIALPKPGDSSHIINAAGKGRIFNISGSGTELTLEDIKLEDGYASTGGAAYVEAGGILALTGQTLVTPSTGSDANTAGKNDVYLANSAKIRVDSGLTSPDPIVARITPADYNEGITVLTGTTIGSDYTRFSVTQPADSTGGIWTIKNDGMLKKEALIIKNTDPNPWKKLQDFVRLTGEGSTITIDGEIKATNAPGNLGEIVIDKNLTIKKADGAASAVLDANKDTDGKPKHRIFKVEGGKTLTLTNLTLKGGKPDGLDEEGGGGGILVKGSTLNMTNCAVTGNTAQDGGGIFAKKEGSTASAVTISGGFIGSDGTGTDANKSTGYSGGGGIYIGEDCSLTMKENVKIIGNQTGASGGGIYTGANCVLTMENCTVSDNTASINGGGIFAQGTLTLTSCTVSDNMASSIGGGAYLAGTVNIKGASTIAHNEAQGSGGGIYAASGSLMLENATIGGDQSYYGTESNKAKGNKAKDGGGIFAQAALTMKNCTVSYNTAETSGISSADGGGIYAQGKLAMTVCTVKSNMAKTGGGIKKDNGKFTMTNCTLTNNIATANGGGIFTMGTCDFTMANCTLSGNRVNLENNESGGGVYMSGRKFTMKGASCITPSTGLDANKKGQNDVYLAGGKMITVEGTLTPVDGIAARIIVSNGEYSTSTKVLTGDITAGVSPNQNYTRFTVTPKGGKNWKINESGHLEPPSVTITGGSSNPMAWQALKTAVGTAQDGDVITIDGEIKATNTTGNNGEITISKNLTIRGKTGAASNILDANASNLNLSKVDRIFDVQGGTLTLENLTLKNGKGAIGGCIFVPSGKVELTDCIIENCTAGGGGAIGVEGEAKLTNTVIKKCEATSTTLGGGAIYTKGGKVTMTNCTLTGNKAKNGGAIYVKKNTSSTQLATVTINGGAIGGTGADANEASKSGTDGGSGGGIYINNSTLKLQNNAKVIGNKASVRGGGIYVGGTDANFTMESGEISSNTVTITESAEIQGGGVCVIDGAKFEMKGGSIKNNTVIAAAADNAKARGGGVCVSGSGSTFIMKDGNPEIINNKVTKADGSNSSMKITTIGGGIYVWDNAKFEMQQGTISGNKALKGSGINYFTGAGGGVCVGGGAGYTNDTAEFKMSGGTISKNEASSNGGGVAVMSKAQFTMTNGTIGGSEADKNISGDKGGGVAVLHGTFEMQNGTVSYNQATGSSGAGGGVYGMNFNSNKGSIIIKGSSSISNNTAMSSGTLAGGGIDGSYKLTIEGDVKIMYNKAPKGFGGGIACSQDAQVELKGCTVEGNTAKELQYGHGVYISYFDNTNTYFKMSGNTKIHKDNNVVLGSIGNKRAFITVTGHLSVNDPNYYPSLTMNTISGYFSSRVVVKSGGSYTLQASDISKFKVTPGGTPQKNWKIVLEGGVGKLKTDP